MKLLPIAIIVCVVVALIFCAYYAGVRNARVIKVADRETTISTTVPVLTTVIREQSENSESDD